MKLEMFYRKTTFWSQPSLSPVLIVHMEETLSRQKMFCAKPALPQCSVQSPRYPNVLCKARVTPWRHRRILVTASWI